MSVQIDLFSAQTAPTLRADLDLKRLALGWVLPLDGAKPPALLHAIMQPEHLWWPTKRAFETLIYADFLPGSGPNGAAVWAFCDAIRIRNGAIDTQNLVSTHTFHAQSGPLTPPYDSCARHLRASWWAIWQEFLRLGRPAEEFDRELRADHDAQIARLKTLDGLEVRHV